MTDQQEWTPLEESVPAEVLKAEVDAWAKRIGVEYGTVTVRRMTRKWGSCTSRGNLTFSTDLLSQPSATRARVIVHELLHFKLPHHGKLFRALMRSYLAEREEGEPVRDDREG